jgi:hypothetical protein
MIIVPVRNPHLAWRQIEGEIVIISPEDSQVHELNETAAFVWMHADGTSSVEEIADALTTEFEVAREAARADISELVGQLAGKRLFLSAVAAEG